MFSFSSFFFNGGQHMFSFLLGGQPFLCCGGEGRQTQGLPRLAKAMATDYTDYRKHWPKERGDGMVDPGPHWTSILQKQINVDYYHGMGRFKSKVRPWHAFTSRSPPWTRIYTKQLAPSISTHLLTLDGKRLIEKLQWNMKHIFFVICTCRVSDT